MSHLDIDEAFEKLPKPSKDNELLQKKVSNSLKNLNKSPKSLKAPEINKILNENQKITGKSKDILTKTELSLPYVTESIQKDYNPSLSNINKIKEKNPNTIISRKNLNSIQMIIEPKNTDVKENIISDDILEKEFEKGFNFKNFYPDSNLLSFIQFQKKQKKKRGEKTGKTMILSNRYNYKAKTKITTKKIVPINDEDDPMRKSAIKLENSHSNLKKEQGKKHSSIFTNNIEKRFTRIQHISFYELVYEVLRNNELRKKLGIMRQKSFIEKKKKFLI